MEFHQLILSFIVLTFLVCGVIIYVLRRTFITSTEGAVKRLDDEIEKASQQQIELSRKIKEADEELNKRRQEANELTTKMRTQAEQESKEEREAIIGKARTEGEEIIEKAQKAKEKIIEDGKREIEEQALDISLEILNEILSEKTRGSFDQLLIDDFLENLKSTSMDRIGNDINDVEVITLNPLQEPVKTKISSLFSEKLNRSLTLKCNTNSDLGGGMVLKFGSLALDGSIKNLIREIGIRKKAVLNEQKG